MNQKTFSYEAKGSVLVIHLPRELDHHNCRNLKYETDLLLAENYVSRIIFDFSHTEFMDSSGIGIVVGRYRLMQDRGGKLALKNLPPHNRRVMQVAGTMTAGSPQAWLPPVPPVRSCLSIPQSGQW